MTQHIIGHLRWCTYKMWQGNRLQILKILSTINVVFPFKYMFFAPFFPLVQSLPFNWKSPFGYLIAMIIFAEATYYLLYCGVIMVCFLVGSCWLIQTIVQDVADDVSAFNVTSKKWNQNRMEMRKIFNKFIDDNSKAKQLSCQFELQHVIDSFGMVSSLLFSLRIGWLGHSTTFTISISHAFFYGRWPLTALHCSPCNSN